MFYNEELNTVILSNDCGKIEFFIQKTINQTTYWKRDDASCEQCSKALGLRNHPQQLVQYHISPNGKYILNCKKGLQVCEFKIEKQSGKQKIVMKPKDWAFPIWTEHYEIMDLAARVKFESNSVIRFLTESNRDILFILDNNDGQTVYYASETRVERLFTKEEHLLKFSEENEKLEDLIHRNSQMMACCWHSQNLRGNTLLQKSDYDDLSGIDRRALVKKHEKGF